MRLKKIQDYLRENGRAFSYHEENGCGSIEFRRRELMYHIWEYPEPEGGAESNFANAGRSIEYSGNYEEELLDILKSWKGNW